MDDTGWAADPVKALALAMPDIVADLAEACGGGIAPGFYGPAIDRALQRLSEILQSPLRLTIGPRSWTCGTVPQRATGAVLYRDAHLEGVPDGFPPAVQSVMQSLLRTILALCGAGQGGAGRPMSEEPASQTTDEPDRLMRRLFDLTPMGVVLIDPPSGQIIEVNAAFVALGHWDRADLLGVPVQSVLPPDLGAALKTALSGLTEGSQFGPVEQPLARADGSSFPAVLRGVMLAAGGDRTVVAVLIEEVGAIRAQLAQMEAMRDDALRARDDLHSAVQALPHGFMLLDADDRFVMVNSQMSDVYPDLAALMVPGARYEDVLRSGIASVWWPEAEQYPDDFVKGVMAARRLPIYDDTVELRDGRTMRILDRQTPTGGRVGLRIDVSAERDAQRRLSQVIEGSQAGTWEADFETGENVVNERWAQMLGWTLAELEPITLETFRSLLHPDDLETIMAKADFARNVNEDRFDMVFRLRHRAGHWVWVQSRGYVSVRDPRGRPLRMAGVHVDVSALKAAEQRLEQIIEGAEVGTWYHDMPADLCHVNTLWAGMLGYTLAELGPVTGVVWRGLLHPDDLDRLDRNMKMRFDSGMLRFEDEFRLRHKDGHWVWIASRGQVSAWDEQGHPTATSGVHLDISNIKRLEVDLEAERDFLSTLMETSGSGILAVDDDGRIVFFNREVQRIFELPNEALLNQIIDPVRLNLSDMSGAVLPFSDLPCHSVLRAEGVIRDMRMRLHLPDGRVKVLSVNSAVLPDPRIEARAVCTITDVTAAARAEDDLRAAIQRAEEASQAKSQFLANMSHELRTPLNGVLGMAELLAEGVGDPKQRAMLAAIRESGTHLLSVVNDILDLAKIESGKVELDLGPLSLRDLSLRIESMHGVSARGKGIDLKVALGPGTATLRMGDATRLLQVLHNLVGNAVKFTEAGSVSLTIEDVGTPAGHLRIVVADTGIGMSDDQTAIVFDEFTQGDDSITRRFGGTGLGLPIVRRLVTLMNGDVALASTLGEGTTVTLTLPMPAVQSVPQPSDAAQPLPDVAGLRVLLAEDNATNRIIMRTMLTRMGLSVTLVCDGDEAVETWQPGLFDLVMLDISMPRKDGLTALAEMRVKAGAAGLPPMLAVTAHAMAQHKADYRAAGFAEVVTKPVSLHALATAIDRTRRDVNTLLVPLAPSC